jgi:chromosome segregation protein
MTAIRNPQSPIRISLMLKALELSGFKSFADRTRFEFPRGISIVVGPNGSGKSNLVDAVKWVLGTQSAKSLRGHEMVDVIFNGAASRGPLGAAEVTLTLDNSERRLPIEARDVEVTRRVYRSGEGEYLINCQPCRLRDIRELLAGTGITTEAYCIIEQGKVDALLQSSPRDRRVIFEEAAGIGQFKSKKAAAHRRLERVDQNLLRLSDIVDEVESRLRSLRAQAGKARRYREFAEKLRHLRTQLGLFDWRALTVDIAERDAQLAELRAQQAERENALERLESLGQELEQSLDEVVERERATEAAAAATREQIVAWQVRVDNLLAQRGDRQQETARYRRQLAAMTTRAAGAAQQWRDAADMLRVAEGELADARAELESRREQLRQLNVKLDDARAALDRCRTQRAAAAEARVLRENQLTSLKSQLLAAEATHQQLARHLAECETQRTTAADASARYQQDVAVLEAELGTQRGALTAAEQRLTHLAGERVRLEKNHRRIEDRLARTRERIAVLAELDERMDGLERGVQDVLRLARESPGAPLGEVCGVVADLFHVDVDSAPMVEVALGEIAQFVVLAEAGPLLTRLESGLLGIAGRVGFLMLDARATITALDHVELSAESGVMGRADRFVESAPQYAPLVRRLLGRTWLVDRLATALRLTATVGRGLSFVTSDGELLAADGTLVVGPRQAVTGMLSRRSELRACHEQVVELERQTAQLEANLARLSNDTAEQEAVAASARKAAAELLESLSHGRQQLTAARVQLEQVEQHGRRTHEQLQHIAEQRDTRAAEIESAETALAAAERAEAQHETDSYAFAQNLAAAKQTVAEQAELHAESQVAVAKCEQRVEMQHHRLEQSAGDQTERERVQDDARRRLVANESQLSDLEAQVLAARQALAELFLRKERHAAELAELQSAADEHRRRRGELTGQIRGERQQLVALQSQHHKQEVSANRLRHERQTLCERMQDDYGIDLGEAAANSGEQVAHSPTEDKTQDTSDELITPFSGSFDRDKVERQIAELRNQINTIGAVNLEALDELDSHEERFQRLSQQYRDLVDAKAALERIIARINADGRQLFQATVENVRGHFQELFRRLFGGGSADIIMDDQEDVLECGIEIVARPPGKEACSISLLSGGEKTLTCVALLLAVFRSKPSPFCILDEVDAALDEANIGRFVGVLRDFLSFTQFVVVTHSKKTMAGADTLYGVTMEESGVSKRVAVRFDDVSEDGQIRPAALRAA